MCMHATEYAYAWCRQYRQHSSYLMYLTMTTHKYPYLMTPHHPHYMHTSTIASPRFPQARSHVHPRRYTSALIQLPRAPHYNFSPNDPPPRSKPHKLNPTTSIPHYHYHYHRAKSQRNTAEEINHRFIPKDALTGYVEHISARTLVPSFAHLSIRK